jgi:hypothetical protein
MQFRLTAVERLDAEHPGLERDVKDMFRRGIPERKIPSLLRKEYGVFVPAPQIWKYRKKRWVPSVQRIERYTEITQGIIRALRKENARLRSGDIKLVEAWIYRISEEVSRGRPLLGQRMVPNPHKEGKSL